MRNRLPMGVAALLLAIIAAGPAAAFEIKLSRLEALAARQGLRDMVCIAMADGRVSVQERTVILMDAKNILYPEEYRIFKRAFSRVSPPPKKRVARHPVKIARKQPVPNSLLEKSVSENSGATAGLSSSAGKNTRGNTAGQASSGTLFQRTAKPRPTAKPPAGPLLGPSLGPVIPAGAILPDRMASIGPVR